MARLVRTEAVVEGRTEIRYTLVEDDDTPEWEPGERPPLIGEPAARVSAGPRTAGTARFTTDIVLPGMLEAAILRSPHPNARLTGLDVEAALAVDGVRAAFGPADSPGGQESPVLTDAPGYAGAPVAAVAADSRAALRAGLAALQPRYETTGFVVDLDEALSRQDLFSDPSEYERGDVESGFADSAATVEATHDMPAQLHSSLEPHCAVADWRPDGVTVWCSTQSIYGIRDDVASTFDLDPERVRVICEFVGGAFGAKFGSGAVVPLATELSRRAGRPVRLVLSRREEQTTTGYRTPASITLKVGASADGTLQAIEGEGAIGLGSDGWTYPIMEPAKSVYACPNVHTIVVPLRQNLGPAAAFRAPGVMEGTFALEGTLDELAEQLGIDPLELRRRNHSQNDPATGRPYTSKRLLECYDRAAELAGWDGRDQLRSDGRIRRGMGCAGQFWWGGGGPPAYAEVRIGKRARATVTVGLQDLGTGVQTACAIVAAERLGVPVESITVRAGDTALAGHGPFSGGSMTMASIVPAVRAAGHKVRQQILQLAGDMFEIGVDDLTLENGEIRSVDGALVHPITEVTGKLGNAWVTGSGSRGPNPEGMAVNTWGCQIATVAVDTATGELRVEKVVAVHDVGRIINSMGARSQVAGGVLQGVGFALMEERVVDPNTGLVVNANLEDYKVPTIADMPEIVCDFVGEPDPHLAVGVKGLGEPPIIPTTAAIANAFAHATGVRLRETPFSPRRILEALG